MIKVLTPGLMTTVQDFGRIGYRRFGVPESGALDKYSFQLANHLVGNDRHSPVLEVIQSGASFEFSTSGCFSLTGSAQTALLNNKEIDTNRAITFESGDILNIHSNGKGLVSYLAISGTLMSQYILGSYSTYMPSALGGFKGRALKKGDVLNFENHDWQRLDKKQNLPVARIYNSSTIRVCKGSEFGLLDAESRETLFSSIFKVSAQSSRMGCRLSGNRIEANSNGIPSQPVFRGTIQLPSEGQPIILLNDCQTTGGYPRILQVVTADLDSCGQLKPGNHVRFRLVSTEKAQLLLNEYQKKLNVLFN